MLVVMRSGHTAIELQGVLDRARQLGYSAQLLEGEGASGAVVRLAGGSEPPDPRIFEGLPGVRQAVLVAAPYRLAGREARAEGSVVAVAGRVEIGKGRLAVIAGPCAVESEEQTLRIARKVAQAGAHMFRGGAYKPRTSPYSFQGLGEKGLEILAAARQATGLPIVTEALDTRSLGRVAEIADVVQIGARNMQNFALLKEAGRLKKPVMLKRGFSATVDEWLMSAEYILAEGNSQVILCERGIRAAATGNHGRSTLDLGSVLAVRSASHLPVIVDPSHGSGVRELVAPLARAAAAVGAHGLMVEVHDRPEEALCDGPQALLPDQFASLMRDLSALAPVLGFSV